MRTPVDATVPVLLTAGLTIGVAMATRDGARFLPELLGSLAAQTRLPDRLAVYDDGSADASPEQVEDFARSVPFMVELVRGRDGIGYADAFGAAARACRTDLIAFCDQDDIWHPQKLERCAQVFERRPELLLVAHGWRVFGQGRRRERQRRPAPSLRSVRIAGPGSTPLVWPPGFAMVISRRLLDAWDALGAPALSDLDWGHDDWFTFLASSLGPVALLPDPLVRYRQHDSNLLGADPSRWVRNRRSIGGSEREESGYRTTAEWAAAQIGFLQSMARDPALRAAGFEPHLALCALDVWRRVARAHQGRVSLYAQRPGRWAGAMLLRHLGRGDYVARSRGGLGVASLGRDVLYAAGLLPLLGRALSQRG